MSYKVKTEDDCKTPSKRNSSRLYKTTIQKPQHKLKRRLSYEETELRKIEDHSHIRKLWLILIGVLGGLISGILFFAAFAAGLLTFGTSLAWLALGAVGALVIGFNYFLLSKRMRDLEAKIAKRTYLLKQKEFGFQPLEYKFPLTTWSEKLYPWLDRLATGLSIAMAFSTLYFQPFNFISLNLTYGLAAIFCAILILNKMISAYFYTQAEDDAHQLKDLNTKQYKKECLTTMEDDTSYISLSRKYNALPSIKWQKLFALIMSAILGTITSAVVAALEGATATTGMYILSIASGILIASITFYAANHCINKNHARIKSKIDRRFGGAIPIDEDSEKYLEPNSWWQNFYQELFSFNSMGIILLTLALVPTELPAIVGIKASWLSLTTINAAILISFIAFQYLQDSFQAKWQHIADSAEKTRYTVLEQAQPQYIARIHYPGITPSEAPSKIAVAATTSSEFSSAIRILSPTANNLPSPT